MTERRLDFYRALPYAIDVEWVTDDGPPYFVARFRDLPGVMSDGVTRAEAMFNARAAFDDAIIAFLEWGREIPIPAGSERFIALHGREIPEGVPGMVLDELELTSTSARDGDPERVVRAEPDSEWESSSSQGPIDGSVETSKSRLRLVTAA